MGIDAIIVEEIRRCCIKNKWYTVGTIAEYENMFKMVINRNRIENIAKDIFIHSERKYAPDYDVVLKEISNIIRKCWEKYDIYISKQLL